MQTTVHVGMCGALHKHTAGYFALLWVAQLLGTAWYWYGEKIMAICGGRTLSFNSFQKTKEKTIQQMISTNFHAKKQIGSDALWPTMWTGSFSHSSYSAVYIQYNDRTEEAVKEMIAIVQPAGKGGEHVEAARFASLADYWTTEAIKRSGPTIQRTLKSGVRAAEKTKNMDASAAPDEDGEQGCINKLYRSPVNCNGYFSRSGLKKCVLVLVVLIVLGVIAVGTTSGHHQYEQQQCYCPESPYTECCPSGPYGQSGG